MTIYISPNPGKTSANEIALRAAQILLTHGAAVLMCKELCAECSTAGVVYLPQEECLERSDVILTIGGDGTIFARGKPVAPVCKADPWHQFGTLRFSGNL